MTFNCLLLAAELVMSTGVGTTYRSAVNEALVSALESHDGITISVNEVSVTSSVETDTLQINDSIKQDMRKWAKGRIESYEVMSVEDLGGKTKVEVAVYFADKVDNRLTITPFVCTENSAWADKLRGQIEEKLVRSRMFTVNTDPNNTDYVLDGKITFYPVKSAEINPLTGKVINPGLQVYAEVNARITFASTGQVKWAETFKVFGPDSDQVSEDIAARILKCYRPIEDQSVRELEPQVVPAVPVDPIPPTTVKGGPNGGVILPF